MWLAHHHEYALLAALRNIVYLSVNLSLPLRKRRRDSIHKGDGPDDHEESMLVKISPNGVEMEGRIARPDYVLNPLTGSNIGIGCPNLICQLGSFL